MREHLHLPTSGFYVHYTVRRSLCPAVLLAAMVQKEQQRVIYYFFSFGVFDIQFTVFRNLFVVKNSRLIYKLVYKDVMDMFSHY
jgi:hypothetical protein